MNKESGRDSNFVVPAAKQGRRQTFRQAWLEDRQFKPWLQQAEDPLKAKCTVCSKVLTAKKSLLKLHANSDIHIMSIQKKAGASISVPSNAATKSVDTSFARPANAAISSSDARADSSSFTLPPSKKVTRQAFRQAWLEDPDLKPWLEQTEDPLKARCRVCSRYLNAKKAHLEQHAATDMHIMNIQHEAGASMSVPSGADTTSIDSGFVRPANAAICSSDAEVESSSAGSSTRQPAKKVKRQAFRHAWLEDPDLKAWLQQAEDPLKAKCTVCSKFLTAKKSDLQIHGNSDAHIMNMVHPKEGLTSTVKRAFAENVKVAEVTICMDATERDRSFQSRRHFCPRQNGEDKRQCQVDEVPSTSSATEAASTSTRRNGETPTTTCRIHPIVHDHRYAKIPRSMWKKILVQKKQIQALKRLRHVDKQHIFRLKKQVTSLKRIVNKLRSTRALPDSGPEKNIKQKQQISKGSGNTI